MNPRSRTGPSPPRHCYSSATRGPSHSVDAGLPAMMSGSGRLFRRARRTAHPVVPSHLV